jgi:hypothetical protein
MEIFQSPGLTLGENATNPIDIRFLIRSFTANDNSNSGPLGRGSGDALFAKETL